MTKYIRVMKNSIAEALIYRSNVFLLFLSQLISLAVFSSLWISIYQQGNHLGTYTLRQLISYYILTSFMLLTVQSVDVAWRVGDDIRLGTITNYILKPINYLGVNFFHALGKSLFNGVIISAFILILVLLMKNQVSSQVDFLAFIFFLLAIIISFCLNYLFFFVVGILTFWMGTVQGLNFMLRMMLMFLAGNYLPLELFPNSLARINNWLPFKYITWFPIAVIQGKLETNWQSFLPGMLWVIGLFFLAKLLYSTYTTKI